MHVNKAPLNEVRPIPNKGTSLFLLQTNTLAYLSRASVTRKKSFITSTLIKKHDKTHQRHNERKRDPSLVHGNALA